MIYLIILVAYFILCQVIVVKSVKIMQFLKRTAASAVTLQGMLVIAVAIAICIGFKITWILAAIVTIFECSIISAKYRLVFEDMEKGKKV
ncbi:hypothetical protein [Lactobacillus panisapium]|uniref:hypothetical protein n=1 Tax=Lactobacillus panisapium TaxID=2012495 RepID=UPI001C6A0C88|nr:hypothetical protein [Lactobacillus panisapium]